MRLRIDLSYDGTDFRGWASQPGLRTVQTQLTEALQTSLRVPRVHLVCAGRTDAGVHARAQVGHLDLEPDGEVPDSLARRVDGMGRMTGIGGTSHGAAAGAHAQFLGARPETSHQIASTG